MLLLLAVGLVPTFTTGAYLVLTERQGTLNDVAAELDMHAREGVALLEARVTESRTAIEAVALNPVLRSGAASDADQQAQLDTARRLYPAFDDITLVTPEGRTSASTDFAYSGSWTSKSWFREALAGTPRVSAAHMGGQPLHLVVVFASPVLSAEGGTVIGVVAGQVAVESLAKPLRAVRAMASDEGDHGSLCLLDARGLVLAGPPGAEPLQPGPPGILSANPGVSEAMGSYWRTAEFPEFGWHVAAQVEQAVVAAQTARLVERVVVGAALVAALAALVAFVLSHRISAAVHRVSRVIDRIGEGRLDHRIPAFDIDEVDQLVAAFNGMATHLEETRAEVARSEEWFRSIVVHGSDAVLVLDPAYRVTYVSPAAERVLGVPPHELLGASILDLLPSADRPRLLRLFREAGPERWSWEHGLRGISPDAVLESSVADLTHVPAVGGLVIHTRDITYRKTLEADVERALELDRLKTEFVGLASHELRTPLTGIYGFSELLLTSPGLPEAELSWVSTIHQEAARLREIIDGLLSISRIESGSFTGDIGAVPLREAIEETLRSGVTDLGVNPIEVSLEGEPIVIATRHQLVEILENIVGNAIKYSPGGGPIAVSVTSRGDAVRVSVRDHGLGIPREAMGSLFERFKRIDTPDRASIRGTGLGLYLVKRYMDAFGGTIEVDSTLGVGTTITLVFRTVAQAVAA
ncbi:MAG: ATP-binding protein [Dehalococcoidia bacterium]